MASLRLPAGTDVGEMAWFDVDALPRQRPRDAAALDELVAQARLVRLPTGSDGGFLLHVYVDEPVPEGIRRPCARDETLTGTFSTAHGRVGFGGVESAYAGFQPNQSIRADGSIAPGDSAYVAYQTDFPEALVTAATDVARTAGERWLLRAPALVVLLGVVVVAMLAITGRFVPAGAAALGCYVVVRWLLRLPAHRSLAMRREQAELAFPSIVLELRAIGPRARDVADA